MMRTHGSRSGAHWGGASNSRVTNISRHTIETAQPLSLCTPLLARTRKPSWKRYEFGQSKVASQPSLTRLTSMVRLIHAFTLLPPSGVVLCAESTWRHGDAGYFNPSINSVKVAIAVGVGSGICEPIAQRVAAGMSATPLLLFAPVSQGACDFEPHVASERLSLLQWVITIIITITIITIIITIVTITMPTMTISPIAIITITMFLFQVTFSSSS